MKRWTLLLLGVLGSAVCLWIFRPKQASADYLPTPTVTFNNEIVGVLDRHCVMCHTENGLSFPLETYEQTFFQRQEIRASTLDKHMPMWPVVPGYGEFVNANSMTQLELDYVVAWVDEMGPRTSGSVFLNVAGTGDASTKVVKAHFDFDRWFLGKPDLLLQVPRNRIAPGSSDQVKETVIDPGLTADRWLRGIEYKPGNRRVVHAAFFRIQGSGEWIGSWTPWYGFFGLPKGLAYHLPAGSHIVADIHYYGLKEPAEDQGSLGLYFADQPSSRKIADLKLAPQCASLAGSPQTQRCTANATLDSDTHVLSLWPKVRPGMQSIEVAAKAPDGGTEVLLFARDLSVAWPTPYILKRPAALRKGTEISVTEYFAGKERGSAAGTPVLLCGYEGEELPSGKPAIEITKTPPSSARRFKMAGVVESVDDSSHTLAVRQTEPPGDMGGMAMMYRAGLAEDMKKLVPGEQIQADVVVRGDETDLENIKVTGHSK